MRRSLGAMLAALAAPAAMAGPPRFVPVDVPAHVYDGGWQHFVGGGLAVFDCDGDQRPELLAAGGENPATLLRNRSAPGAALAFVADTPPVLARTGLTGAYPLDIDGDGHTDLALLSTGRNTLLRGLDDCAFAPFPDGGLPAPAAPGWTTAFSATWEAGRARPTLAFGNYVDRADPDGPFGACDINLLYRPEGGHYTAPQRLAPGHCALSMLFSDWARRGRADLRVSNDRHYYVSGGAEQLWLMPPDGAPRLATEADGWQRHELWGMGIASRDVTGDGRPDVYLSSMGDQRLQVLQPGGTPTWRDAPYDWGTSAHRPHTGDDGRPSTGWHTAFGDVQNDGRADIFVAKGNVDQMPGLAMRDPNSLLVATGPRAWTEMAGPAGVASPHRGRGAALADLDLDGRLDLAVVNRRAPLQVWRNVTDDVGRHVALALRQPGPNRDAVGAWIALRAQGRARLREVTVGGGHAGGTRGPAHFGLGAAPGAVQLRVTWPDGTESAWATLPADGWLLVRRDGRALDITPLAGAPGDNQARPRPGDG